MRNKIELWIGTERADLDNQSFLLLNYTMEELSNPTIVKNSFSRQITLKGTPQNNKIFGGIYRNDRSIDPNTAGEVGPAFDPTRKTSFKIYDEYSELLEEGYLKLDKVSMVKKRVEYTITLYGSLGSFLYGLSYKSNGDKMTLADLDFGETLDFTIDRDAVSGAWARLDGDSSKPAKWDIINFMPTAYMGLPPSPFDANKAIVKAASVGLPTRDGDYSTNDGWALLTLSEKVTGNEAKDYRSYLQKPVIKFSEIINAICDPSNNGGWTVNLDASFFTPTNPYWANAWMTLPMLNDLNIDESSTSGSDNFTTGTFTIPGGGNISKLYNVQLVPELWGDIAGSDPTGHYVLDCEDDWAAGMSPDDSPGFYLNYLEWEVIGYDSNNNILKQFTFRASTAQPPAEYPQMDDLFDYIEGGINFVKNGQPWLPALGLSEYGLAKVTVNFSIKGIAWGHLRGGSNPYLMWPDYSYDFTDGESFSASEELLGSWIYYNAVSSSTVRTGASITKANLLGRSNTPADYLLSYCKMFGLQFVCKKGEKTIDIIARTTFYSGNTIDIHPRIDRGRNIEKLPFAFDARWYLFGNDPKGEFAEYYKNKYTHPFGQYRVNTGFEFNADEKSMTDSIVFGNAVDVMETSKYFCDLTDRGINIPSIFLGGGKYTLFKGGESKDYDIPYPVNAIKVWFNTAYPMHDDKAKVQIHGANNAHLDERDTLLFLDGMVTPASSHLTLSDDVRAMLSLNGNNPCWMPNYCDFDATWKITKMPRFTRYVWSGNNISYQMDFGDPSEVQIPGASITPSSNIFEQFWLNYISDRYDDNSIVLTCYVDWRGYQVGPDLFKDFYWFDGCVWALNKIINYSLTTSGPVQCEFVKVQDTTHYTS